MALVDAYGTLARGRGWAVVHETATEDRRVLPSRLQYFLSESQNAGLVLAGRPSSVGGLLHDHALMFLRSADPVELGRVPLPEMRDAVLGGIPAARAQFGAAVLASTVAAALVAVGFLTSRKSNTRI